jgi:hypothetical protein
MAGDSATSWSPSAQRKAVLLIALIQLHPHLRIRTVGGMTSPLILLGFAWWTEIGYSQSQSRFWWHAWSTVYDDDDDYDDDSDDDYADDAYDDYDDSYYDDHDDYDDDYDDDSDGFYDDDDYDADYDDYDDDHNDDYDDDYDYDDALIALIQLHPHMCIRTVGGMTHSRREITYAGSFPVEDV